MTLDEKALRKPEFTEGPKLVLGDGQQWTFPKPILKLYPQRDDEGKVYLAGRWTYGDDHDDRLDLYNEQSAVIDRLESQFRMSAELLSRNYDLDNRALRRLLPLAMQGDDNLEMWRSIMNILNGTVSPESLPEDSDSTPSQTSQTEPAEALATA